MTVHLSRAEAERLGINRSRVGAQTSGCPPVPTRIKRRPREPYRTRCTACGAEFTTMAGETRHLESTSHRRFELVLA